MSVDYFKTVDEESEEDLENDHRTRMELLKIQTAEYQCEMKRLNKTFKRLGFDNIERIGFNDEALDEMVDSLSEVAYLLEVDDFSETGLDLAVADLRLKAAKVPIETLIGNRNQASLQKEELDTLQSLNLSEETLLKAESGSSTRESEMLQIRNKIEFLRGKKKQYENQLEKYSSRLRMSGFRKEISHQAIVELKASLDSAIQNELKPLKLKLDSYRGLPPNKDLVIARIAEAEKEEENLSITLSKAISSMHV